MAIKFVLNETSYFGEKARDVLPEEIKKRNFKKVFLVSDKSLVEAGVTAKVENILKEANIDSNIRGEKLTIEQFANLSNLIYETI